MLVYDLNRAQAALQYLVAYTYAPARIRKLRTFVQKKRALPFKGDAEVLNELLIVGRQDRKAMENLIALAEFKRSTHNEYQAKFMANKRRREREVIAITELMLGKTLDVDERNAELLRQYDIWNKEKAEHIKDCTDQFVSTVGAEPGGDQRNAFIRDFWCLKDMELHMLREKATEIASKRAPAKRHLTVVEPIQPKRLSTPQLMQKLASIVDAKRK